MSNQKPTTRSCVSQGFRRSNNNVYLIQILHQIEFVQISGVETDPRNQRGLQKVN